MCVQEDIVNLQIIVYFKFVDFKFDFYYYLSLYFVEYVGKGV